MENNFHTHNNKNSSQQLNEQKQIQKEQQDITDIENININIQQNKSNIQLTNNNNQNSIINENNNNNNGSKVKSSNDVNLIIKSKPVEKWVVMDIIQNNNLHPTQDWNEQFYQDLHRTLLNQDQQDTKRIGQVLGVAVLGLVGFALSLTLIGFVVGSVIGVVMGGYAGKRIKRKKKRKQHLIHFDLFMINCACYFAVLLDEVTRNKGSISLNNFRFKIQKTMKEYKGVQIYHKLSKSRQKGFKSEMIRLIKVLQCPEGFKAMYLIYKITKIIMKETEVNRSDEQRYDIQQMLTSVLRPAVFLMRICYDELTNDQKYLLLKYEKFTYSYESLQILEDNLPIELQFNQEEFLLSLEKEVTVQEIKNNFKNFNIEEIIVQNEQNKQNSPQKDKGGKKLIDLIQEQILYVEQCSAHKVPESNDINNNQISKFNDNIKKNKSKDKINSDTSSNESDEIPQNQLQELESSHKKRADSKNFDKIIKQNKNSDISNDDQHQKFQQDEVIEQQKQSRPKNKSNSINSNIHSNQSPQPQQQQKGSTKISFQQVTQKPGYKEDFLSMEEDIEIFSSARTQQIIANPKNNNTTTNNNNDDNNDLESIQSSGYQGKSFIRNTRGGTEFLKCPTVKLDFVPSKFKDNQQNVSSQEDELEQEEQDQNIIVGTIEKNSQQNRKNSIEIVKNLNNNNNSISKDFQLDNTNKLKDNLINNNLDNDDNDNDVNNNALQNQRKNSTFSQASNKNNKSINLQQQLQILESNINQNNNNSIKKSNNQINVIQKQSHLNISKQMKGQQTPSNRSLVKDDLQEPDHGIDLDLHSKNKESKLEDMEIQNKLEKLFETYNEGIEEGKWNKVIDKDNIAIHKKQNLETAAVMVRVSALIKNATAEDIFRNIYDAEYRAKWDKVLLGFKQIEKIDEFSDMIYSYVEPGMGVQKREWVQKRYFKKDYPEKGQITICYFSSEHPQYPIHKKIIRADSVISGYVMKNVGNDCDLFILSCNDIKGLIPKYVVNYMAARAPKDWINALQKNIDKDKKNQKK